MTYTLLFDLDNTLLGNDIDTFLPVYVKALSQHMAGYVDPHLLVENLQAATAKMIENRSPNLTLEEVFDARFYPALGIKKEQVRGVLDTFYAEEFPKLRELTRYKPEAVETVKTAMARGYQVAIATNPLFPGTAIQQRLAWAGLPPHEFPFELIPSYHEFHFAKPSPAYFAEIMAKLSWPEGPVVMVGNSLADDIAAAGKAGLATFWVHQEVATLSQDHCHPTGQGTLAELLPWLDSLSPDSLLPDTSTPSAILATLRSTPALFYSLCADLPREAWICQPAQGEWSPIEILCHLVDMDSEVNLPRLRKVSQETNPFVVGVDTDSWADSRQYIQRDGQQSLQKFVNARLELIAFLESLSPEAWLRQARHAVFGPTCLQEMAIFAANHDRLHVRQIFQTIPVHDSI